MMTKTFGFVKMPQRRDSAGAICNSGNDIFFLMNLILFCGQLFIHN